MANEITFEQIDKHINKTNLKLYQPGGKMHFTAKDVATANTSISSGDNEVYTNLLIQKVQ